MSNFKRYMKGLAYWLFGEVLCFVICIMTLSIMHNILLLKILIGICVLTVTLGLYFNYAHYAAKNDRERVKLHNAEYDKFMPLKMAVAAPFPSYVMWIILLLSKIGIVKDIFSQYIMLNIYILPFISMFTERRTIDSITPAGIAGILFLILLSPITIIITYKLTFNEIDVARQILYKKQDK
jgi:hypothetical protein